MKKSLGLLAGLLCAILILFCGCSTDEIPEIPERPEDTNLEFWLLDDVDDYDWEGHYHYVLGSAESFLESYWGTGYEPAIESNGVKVPPKHCVSYSTKYLHTANGARKVISAISITDPAVTVYGLTANSTFEEFDTVFQEMGYKIKIEKDDHPTSPYISHFAKAKGIRVELCVYTETSTRILQFVAETSMLHDTKY